MNNQAFSIKSEPAMAQENQYCAPSEDVWALVPAKNLRQAKQRLVDCLGSKREALTIAMFKDVIAALQASEEVSKIVIVTSDPQLTAIAQRQDILVLAENGSIGLNQAIKLGVSAIRKLGGGRVAILPSDIPLLTGSELDRLVRLFKQQREIHDHDLIGISASTDHNGTNCLIINTQQSFTTRYGAGSYRLHSDSAEEQACGPVPLNSATISMDIDERQDLQALLCYCEQNPEFQNTETFRLLDAIQLT